MNGLRFYYDHSLLGYFSRRAKQKWFTPPPPPLESRICYHGIWLQVDCLPHGMQDVIRCGRYEQSEMKLIADFISPSDKVLEIGSAIGFVSLFCRKIVGVQKLVCVEPNPKTLSYLRLNYELNGLIPEIIEAAVSVDDGPLQFRTSNMFWADSLYSRTDVDTADLTTVNGLSLSSIMERAQIKPDVIIIDIEGGEKNLPFEMFPINVTKVLIEIHPDIIGFRQAYMALEALIRLGFEVQCHHGDVWGLKKALNQSL
jgi:FkbM family methyltransferase